MFHGYLLFLFNICELNLRRSHTIHGDYICWNDCWLSEFLLNAILRCQLQSLIDSLLPRLRHRIRFQWIILNWFIRFEMHESNWVHQILWGIWFIFDLNIWIWFKHSHFLNLLKFILVVNKTWYGRLGHDSFVIEGLALWIFMTSLGLVICLPIIESICLSWTWKLRFHSISII